MSTTVVGALIGGAIDSMMGDDDSSADGALIGAVTAHVLKFTLPIVATYAIGWGVLKGVSTLAAAGSDRVKELVQ